MPPVDGTGLNGVCLLGEAYGAVEAQHNTPFRGPAGFRLERMVQMLGANRQDFLLTNTVWHQPPGNREPSEVEVEAYRDRWEGAIKAAHIKVVVPLGNVPLRAVLGHWGIQGRRGYLEWSNTLACWVLPTVHPSFIMRGNANWTAAWVRDVGEAVRIAREGPPRLPERVLTLDPPPDVAQAWGDAWEAAGRPPLAVDIETPDKSDDEEENELQARGEVGGTIYRVGFAYRSQHVTYGLSIPWGSSYTGLAQQLLGHADTALVWNRHFDIPRLRAHGVIAPLWHDVQELWHVLHTDLKKSLEFVAPFLVPAQPYWKDQAWQRPAYYNAVDAALTVEGYAVLWGGGLSGGTAVPQVQTLPAPLVHDDDIPF